MAVNTEIISKGIYGRAQISGYVSVKQYMFIRYAGKKHLLIRFTNDLDAAIDGISYTVVQMNVNGDVIGVSRLEHRARVKSGDSFSSEAALVVDEACTDVKITVNKALSGAYEYSVRGGLITVGYNSDAPNVRMLKPAKLIPALHKTKNKTTAKTTAVAIVAILTVILINLAVAFAPIIKEELFANRDKENDKIVYVPFNENFNEAE